MNWISVKDGKPTGCQMCYVTNFRSGTNCFLALYEKHYDIFRMYDPKMYDHPPIDVTHYVVLPSTLEIKE